MCKNITCLVQKILITGSSNYLTTNITNDQKDRYIVLGKCFLWSIEFSSYFKGHLLYKSYRYAFGVTMFGENSLDRLAIMVIGDFNTDR